MAGPMIKETYATFDEFWPDFLRAHAHPLTRSVHYFGMIVAIVMIAWFLATGDAFLLLLGVLAPYVFGFASHALIEHNQPVSLKHPVYSVRGAIRMFVLWLVGKLGPELKKAGVLQA